MPSAQRKGFHPHCRENSSLVDFVRNAEENSNEELAERVGVFNSDSAEPHEIESNSTSGAKSASSSLPRFASVCIRLPLFADFASAMTLEMTLAAKDFRNPRGTESSLFRLR
jgi:hypothetical protein